MQSHELKFRFEGAYSDYQIQQLVAERIFAMQGHQNQFYRVRNVRWLQPGLCEVTLYVRQTLQENDVLAPPLEQSQPSLEQSQPSPEERGAAAQESLPAPPDDPGPAPTGAGLDELSLYEGPEE